MSYQEFWDRQSETVEAAIRAVDGSSDELTVQHTGVWTANQVANALNLLCALVRRGRVIRGPCFGEIELQQFSLRAFCQIEKIAVEGKSLRQKNF